MSRSVRIAAALSLTALAGCAGLGNALLAGFTKPEVHVVSAEPTAIDFEGVTIAVDLRVQNPNSIGLRARGFSWQVDVEGSRVATGDAPGGLTLPANGTATSRVTARLRFADLRNLAKLVEGRQAVSLRVAGDVAVETPVGPIAVPWSWGGDLPVPRLPRVEMGGIRPGRQSFGELELLVRLRVENPNAFPLPPASVRRSSGGAAPARGRPRTRRRAGCS